MDTEAALDFLRGHQPLPDDPDLDDALAREFDGVRAHFTEVEDRRCVALLLNAFGKGSGHGTYQLVEDALGAQDQNAVADAVPSAIRSNRGGVQDWAIEIAVDYASRSAVEAVKDVWDTLDPDRRFWAAMVVRQGCSASQDSAFVQQALSDEQDDEVREQLTQIPTR